MQTDDLREHGVYMMGSKVTISCTLRSLSLKELVQAVQMICGYIVLLS